MSRMSHLFPTGKNKSWTNHQNERPLSIWIKRTWKPSKDSRRNTTSQSIGLSISVFIDTFQRWLSGFKKMNPETTDAEESFWKGFRNTSWLSLLRKISQRLKENLKRRFKNFSPRILKCEKSISSRWKKGNRSVYAYFCKETLLIVISS